MQWKFIRITAVLATGIFFLSAGTLLTRKQDAPELVSTKINLALRAIGHQLLLHGNDSTSRVLPVKQVNAFTYQIEFQSAFSFLPDTLASVVQRSLASADLPGHYMVSVLNCTNDSEVVYGYLFMKEKKEELACSGRMQPKGCYVIRVAFPGYLADSKASSAQAYVWLTALSAMVLVAFVGSGWQNKRKKVMKEATPPEAAASDFIPLGKYAFDDKHRTLTTTDESIELSDKECRLLRVFALRPNQVIDRDQLLKEVWEDDGVFVGRSLDVFVSKLRRKLQHDPTLRIANVHGKGYKLETGIVPVA